MTYSDLRDSALKILVVDDEPLILMELEFQLEDAGLRPTIANTVDKALALVDSDMPDAAILDVNMGHGTTSEPVAIRLKELSVPFILHSGDLVRQGEFVEKFGVPILRKPTTTSRLVDALGSVMPNPSES